MSNDVLDIISSIGEIDIKHGYQMTYQMVEVLAKALVSVIIPSYTKSKCIKIENMADTSQMKFSNSFSLKKYFFFKFHWGLFIIV